MGHVLEGLLDMEQAADHAGCSPYTIRWRMRYKGLGETQRIANKIFFTYQAIDDHFAAFPLPNDARRIRRS